MVVGKFSCVFGIRHFEEVEGRVFGWIEFHEGSEGDRCHLLLWVENFETK